MAKDSLESKNYQVIAGYMSPVCDAYRKPGLVSTEHRIKMCDLAVEGSHWISTDRWEASQDDWTTTATVLMSFRRRLDILGLETVRIKLVAGADLIRSFSVPDLWAAEDSKLITGPSFGLVIIERSSADVTQYLLENSILFENRDNIVLAPQHITNDISSTKIRLFVRRHLSIRYLVPDAVVDYIQTNGLYLEEEEPRHFQ